MPLNFTLQDGQMVNFMSILPQFKKRIQKAAETRRPGLQNRLGPTDSYGNQKRRGQPEENTIYAFVNRTLCTDDSRKHKVCP